MQLSSVFRSALYQSLAVGAVAAAVLIGCSSSDRTTGGTGGSGDKNLGPFISNGPMVGSTDMATGAVHDMSSPIVVPQADLSAPASGGACGTVTYDGYCTGTVVTWCQSSMLKTYDCATDGLNCTVVSGAADCR